MPVVINPYLEFAEIARDVSASLRYLANLGCRGADCPKETLAVVRSWDMAAVRIQLMQCRQCRLAAVRKRVVCGQGNLRAAVVFVGGIPEPEDDETGQPYSGQAGELLTRIIAAMNLSREAVYITHAVKCRPGGGDMEAVNASAGGRSPDGMPDKKPPTVFSGAVPRAVSRENITAADKETGIDDAVCRACRRHLAAELTLIRPRIICALGDLAARSLSDSDLPVSRLRGRFFPFRGSQVMATFSPEHMLSHPSAKRRVWEDVKKIMVALAGHG